MRRVSVGLGLLLIVGCAGAPPAPARAPAAKALAVAPAATASAPKECVELPPGLEPDAPLFAYVRGPELRASALFKAWMSTLGSMAEARAHLEGLKEQCGFSPLEKLESLVLSGSFLESGAPDFQVLVLEVGADVSGEQLGRCLAGMSGQMQPLEIGGHFAVGNEHFAVMLEGRRVWLGSAATLTERLASPRRALNLPSTTYLWVSTETKAQPEVTRLQVSLATVDGRSVVRASGMTPSAEAAERLQAQVDQQRTAIRDRVARADLPAEAKASAQSLLDDIRLRRDGSTLVGELDLSAERATELGAYLGQVAVEAAHHYQQLSKTAEARLNVVEIAKGLSMRVIDRGLARFGESAPRTPSTVPSGSAVLVPASAWQQRPWHDIGFSMPRAQNYAYEYEVRKGGKSAIVRALGDLDGDGVQSKFELEVTISAPGEALIGPALHEEQAEE